MRRMLLILAFVAMPATVSLAQNSGYLLINNNDVKANSVDIDTVSATGALHRLATLATGGFGGNNQFGTSYNAVEKTRKCFFVSDGGSSDIASFQIPSLNKVPTNFSNPSLVGGAALAASPDGTFLYSGWPSKIAVLSINSDCSLTLVGDPIPQPDEISSLTVTSDGKVLVVAYPNLGGAQAYSINETNGTLTALGPQLLFANEIAECRSFDCWPAGQDVTTDGKFWVWGNQGLEGPLSSLSATLGPNGFSDAAIQEYTDSPLANVENVWFSPAGRAGKGNLYLSGSAVTGRFAGIIVATFNAGTITYAGTTTNDAAFYAGNVQTIGDSGTGSPITIVWSSFTPVQSSLKGTATNIFTNTVQSYTVSGTTLEPSSSLNTTSTENDSLSTAGVGK
jgi:hypothetical protein